MYRTIYIASLSQKKNSLASRHQYANFVIFSMLQNLYKFSPSYEPEKILEYSE